MFLNGLYRFWPLKYRNVKQKIFSPYQPDSLPKISAWSRQIQLIGSCGCPFRLMLASQIPHANLSCKIIPQDCISFQPVLSSECKYRRLVSFSYCISRTYLPTLELSALNQKQKQYCFQKRNSRQFSIKGDSIMDATKMHGLLRFLESLKNYEKEGIPDGAGTDTEEGFDLRRMERLIQLLGDPLSQYPVIHIAGTKGKGSTSAFISKILREEGYSVGVYTSPHICSICERIVTGKKGEIVSPEALENLFQSVKDSIEKALQIEGLRLTHFEVFTALAFKYFAMQKIDIAIVEAGLGGVRDATNVIRSEGLLISVITTIGKEHMKALGGSLESIAVAKSGIIKQRRPVVLGGPFESQIEHILLKKAEVMNAPVTFCCGPGIDCMIKRLDFVEGVPHQYADISIKLDASESEPIQNILLSDVKIGMLGYHQLQNAVTAVCTALCLRKQGWKISDKSIISGLGTASLPGRFQILTLGEAKFLGVEGATIILDGAHTEGSAKALADTIKMVYPDKPLAFVISMANDKDHSVFAWQLLSGARPRVVIFSEVTVAGGSARTTPACVLLEIWTQKAQDFLAFKDCKKLPDDSLNKNEMPPSPLSTEPCLLVADEPSCIESAIKQANKLLKYSTKESDGIICVTGSLHAIAAVIRSVQR